VGRSKPEGAEVMAEERLTEQQWFDPAVDIGSLWYYLEARVCHRKVRLWGCACCRRVWHLLTDGYRNLIEASERFADGTADPEALRAARARADVEERIRAKEQAAANRSPLTTDESSMLHRAREHAARAVDLTAGNKILVDPFHVSFTVMEAFGRVAAHAAVGALLATGRDPDEYEMEEAISAELDDEEGSRSWDAEVAERAAHVPLVRDIVGNPFHPSPVDPTWRTEATVGLARFMYEPGDFSPMPVLADALEEAGCSDAVTLAHCREPGVHVRGCWLVDEVLEKDRYPPADWITPENFDRITTDVSWGGVLNLLGGYSGNRTNGQFEMVDGPNSGSEDLPGDRSDWIGPTCAISVWTEGIRVLHKRLWSVRPVAPKPST
jgi:hypothetical protein